MLTLLLTACDPFEEELELEELFAAPPPEGATVAMSQQIDRGGEAMVRGLTLLSQHYVGGADLSILMTAGQRGAWNALAQVGVPPRDVELPASQQMVTESMQSYHARFGRTAQAYQSKVDPMFLAHEMLRKAAESLDDCHTGFLSARQVRDQRARMTGTTRFGGIGVILRRQQDGGGFLVVDVFEEGPAYRAGLRVGDRVVSVDDEKLVGLGIEQVVQLVRGPEGQQVRIGISRPPGEQQLQFDIVRGQVSAPVLKAQIMEGDIGYLHFYAFPAPLTEHVDGALRDFERRGVRAVIVDLRDNSGGQLDVVTKVTSRFVKDGPLFQGINSAGERTVHSADGSYWSSPRPLVVLTNAGTGSGGEIFAAAVKEHRVGTIVGTTTSGCVSTGQMFPLPDGSAMEIATNRVLSGVGGVELNKVGVAPHVIVPVAPMDVATEREQQLAKALEIIRRG